MKLRFNLDAYFEIPGTMVMLKTNFKGFIKSKLPYEFAKFIEEDFKSIYTIKEVSPDYYFGRNIIINHTRSNKEIITLTVNSYWLDFLNGEYIKL